MEFRIDRRTVLKAGAALAASQALPAWTQEKPRLRLTGVYQEKDIRFETFRRLAKDDERPPQTLAGLHVLAFARLIAHKAVGS